MNQQPLPTATDHMKPAIAADETFDGTYPFTAHYSQAAGFLMHYLDEGEGEGAGNETFLVLHGEPSWSYLFRQQIPVWAKLGRVIAPDHMGFGKSAAPQDRTYWLQDHVDNLEKLVLELNLSDITLVMHDFGGPVGMGLAIRQPQRIKRVVSVNGPTPAGQADLIERLVANASVAPWFQWIGKAQQDGSLEQVLGQLNFNILSVLKINGFERHQIINDNWLNAYRAPFPTPAHAIGAIGWAKGFAINAHQFAEPDQDIKNQLAKKPALAIWGEADRTLHAEHFLPLLKSAFPNGEIVRLPGVGHYSPEDAAQQVAALVEEFVIKNN